MTADNSTVDSRDLTFGYDGQQQLTTVTDNSTSTNIESYSYDSIGNRIDSTLGPVDAINDYSNLSYNPRGDLTDDGTNAYTWDAKDRLNSITPDNPGSGKPRELFHYDAQNRLVQEDTAYYTANFDDGNDGWSTPTVATKFVYDGTQLVQQISGFSNKPTVGYVWGPDDKLQALITYSFSTGQPNAYYVAQNDANGNLQELINASTGSVALSVRSDSYGNILSSSGSSTLLREAGFVSGDLRRDPDSGLLESAMRWMDPPIGEWMSPDTIEEAGGDNLKPYAKNDPINLVDPQGTSPVGDVWSVLWSGIQGAGHGLYVAGESAKNGVSWLAGTAVDAVNAGVIVATNGEHRLYQQGPDLSYFNDLGQYSSRPEAQSQEAEVKQNALQNVLTIGIAGQGKAAINRYYGLIDDDQFTKEFGGTAITQLSPVLSKGTGQGLFGDSAGPGAVRPGSTIVQRTTPPSVQAPLRLNLDDFDISPAQNGTEAPNAVRPAGSATYSVIVEAKLKPGTFTATDASQFRQANRQLYDLMQADSRLAAELEADYPGITAHVTPGPRGGFADTSPPGLTWHHDPNVPGNLQLVPRDIHRAPGPVQQSLHPNQQGGREIWGGGSANR